jgi:1-acyl-sn-glycerol-3-phosphate acyltransferase
MKHLFAFLYKLAGWRISGVVPHHVKKAVWVACPHWKNIDFPIGIGARSAMNIKVGFLAKSSLFKWYSGWLFRALGGFPVHRDRAYNLVDSITRSFREHDEIRVIIAPEGTRSDVSKLKTGFYYMALKANVPLVLIGFDYGRKVVEVGPILHLTGDYVKDMKPFYEYYLTIQSPRKQWLKNYAETGVIPLPSERK